MLTEVKLVRVFGLLASVAFTGQPALVDQMVVFHEPHEHTAQHPRHGNLIEIVLPPDFKRIRRASTFLNLRIRFPQTGIDLGTGRTAGLQIFG